MQRRECPFKSAGLETRAGGGNNDVEVISVDAAVVAQDRRGLEAILVDEKRGVGRMQGQDVNVPLADIRELIGAVIV